MILYNNILRKLIQTIGLPFGLLSYLTTFILGLVALVPIVGWLMILIFEFSFAVLFVWPLFGLSYLFLKVKPIRPIVGAIGVVYSFVCYAIVVMIPSFGNLEERMMRLLYAHSFPFNKPLYLNMASKEIPSDYYIAKDLQEVILKTVPISPQMAYYVSNYLYGFPWV